MNGSAVKAGVVALIASPVDDAVAAALLGRAVAPELTWLFLAVGMAVAVAVVARP